VCRTLYRHVHNGPSSWIASGTPRESKGFGASAVEVLKLLRGQLRTKSDRLQPRLGTQLLAPPYTYHETNADEDMGFRHSPPRDPPPDMEDNDGGGEMAMGIDDDQLPFEDWQPSFVAAEPELLQVIQEYHNRPPKTAVELTNNVFPNDGGKEDDGINAVNTEDLGEFKKPLFDFMCIMAGVAAKKHLTEDVVTSFLEAYSNTEGLFVDGLVAKMPTDAKNMFSYILAEFSPKLIKYQICRVSPLAYHAFVAVVGLIQSTYCILDFSFRCAAMQNGVS
jgi:hypothetical protein